jgi:hypothetical protein
MFHLELVNNSGQDVWLETHDGGEVRPVMQATQPLGPYSSKDGEFQVVGTWEHDDAVIFIYFKKHNADSDYRVDCRSGGSVTLLVPPRPGTPRLVDRSSISIAAMTNPTVRTVLGWVAFVLLAVLPLLAILAFALYKRFGGKKQPDFQDVYFDD